ncbi:MAG: M20/M25/M40 family metallo-hydrolase [Planctomycetota bacterium]
MSTSRGDMDLDYLKQLSNAFGVPGREERIRDLLKPKFDEVFDDVSVDTMGSLIGVKKNEGKPRVLLSCHIDEIGFYVRHIDDRGFLRVQNVGGFDTRNLLARRVTVMTQSGDMQGVMNPGGRPIHIAKDEDKKKIPEIQEFIIDLGLPGEQVKEKVQIGDPVALVQEASQIGETIVGKCMDNRVAAWVVLEALKRTPNPNYEVILAATVQEEVGLRGAGPAAFATEPDLAIALDTTLCVDTPGVPDEERVTKQGDGVAIKILDSSSISNRAFVDEMAAAGKAKGVKFQFSVLPRGGTDAAAIQRSRSGVKTITLAVPTRNIHTVTEMVHLDDLDSAVSLIAAWLAA